jgi:virginiamycin B lyase
MSVPSSAWSVLLCLGGVSLAGAQDTIPAVPISSRAAATLSIPGYVDFLASDGAAVWVTNEGRVEQLRLEHAQPVASVRVPEPCGAMVAAFGSLWVASCFDRAVYRVDLQTHRTLAVIRTGLADPSGELSLAAGAGSIWVLSDSVGRLARVDHRTNQIIAHVTVAPRSYAAVFDFGSVWITNTGPANSTAPGAVQRIDPASNQVVATIPVGPVPRFLAAGEGGVWTLNQGDGTVSRVDPATNRRVGDIPVGVPGSGGDIAVGAGRVWVRATTVLLSAIDPISNRVVARYGPPSGSGAVRVAAGRVWVTAHDVDKVWVLQ